MGSIGLWPGTLIAALLMSGEVLALAARRFRVHRGGRAGVRMLAALAMTLVSTTVLLEPCAS